MNSFALASVTAAVLAAGLVAAAAQSDHNANRKEHPVQTAPSAQGTVQLRAPATTGIGAEKDLPAANRDKNSEPLLAAGRALSRYKTKPSGKVSAAFECFHRRRKSLDCKSRNGTYAG